VIVEVVTSIVCPPGEVFVMNTQDLYPDEPIRVIRPPDVGDDITLLAVRSMALKKDAPDWLQPFRHATWIGPGRLWVEP
jgi:hypothetical protein